MIEQQITVGDLSFAPYISAQELEAHVEKMAEWISGDFEGKQPVLVGVLNGAFMFLADLSRKLDFEHEIEFVKLSSYDGTESTGTVQFDLDLMTDVEGRDIIVVEDIVDTGLTMKTFREHLIEERKVNSLSIATLLFKKELFEYEYALDYVGIEIPPVFVVGYGLDYNGLGRNLSSLYQKVES